MDSIVVKGSHFFHESSGEQFFLKGVTYYDDAGASMLSFYSGLDLLADPERCTRDIPFMVRLGINTIQVKSIDPKVSHNTCMQLLQSAGIYVLIYLNGSHSSAPHGMRDAKGYRVKPHDYEMMDYYKSIIDAFQRYPNTLGFIAGGADDDIMPGIKNIPSSKATVRNMKEYASAKNYTKVLIGAESSDTNRTRMADYMNCGEKDSSVDFFFISAHSKKETLCDNISSWFENGIVDDFDGFSVPVFFTSKCPNDMGGDYKDIPILFSNNSVSRFSGVIVDAWTDFSAAATSDFGLVDVKGGKVLPRPQYLALSSRLANAQPSQTLASQYSPTDVPPSCHNFTSREFWDYDTNVTRTAEISTVLPSKPYRRSCACMMETLGCIANPNSELSTTYETWASVCSKNPELCQAVNIDTGAWRGCNFTERFSWTFSAAYKAGGSDVCSSVNGIVRPSLPPSALTSDCQSMLKQAGVDGMGRISITPTPLTDSYLFTRVQSGRSGLSTGAKVGLIVGITVALVLTTILILLRFYFRSKRKEREAMSNEPKNSSDGKDLEWQKAELDSKPITGVIDQADEIDGEEVKELDTPATQLGGSEIHELDSPDLHELATTDIYELPSEDNHIFELGMGVRSPVGDAPGKTF